MKKKIVIITDCIDVAFNELHRTIEKHLIEQQSIQDYQIDPLVAVKPFSVENAAFMLRLLSNIYDSNTIFHVVVNGTNQSPVRIFGRLNNGITFVGNNSGYFNWMIKDHGLSVLYKNKINRDVNSLSFGGKHVGAPTVAKIVANEPLESLGEKVDASFLSNYEIKDGCLVHCDNFGLMKIKYSQPLLLNDGERIRIFVNGQYKVTAIYTNKWKLQPDGTWVLFPGSSLGSMPELGKVRSPCSAGDLRATEGDLIIWEKI